MTGESKLKREVKYLMADDRSTEKDLMVMGWNLFWCMLPRVGLVLTRARRKLG